MERIIKKSGGEFRIIAHTNAVYLAEHWIDGRMVSYEVGGLKVSRGYMGVNDAYFTIKGAEEFGKGKYDGSFPKRMREFIFSRYDEIKKEAKPPKGWEDVLGYEGEKDYRKEMGYQ